jgi:hypothetical protein
MNYAWGCPSRVSALPPLLVTQPQHNPEAHPTARHSLRPQDPPEHAAFHGLGFPARSFGRPWPQTSPKFTLQRPILQVWTRSQSHTLITPSPRPATSIPPPKVSPVLSHAPALGGPRLAYARGVQGLRSRSLSRSVPHSHPQPPHCHPKHSYAPSGLKNTLNISTVILRVYALSPLSSEIFKSRRLIIFLMFTHPLLSTFSP